MTDGEPKEPRPAIERLRGATRAPSEPVAIDVTQASETYRGFLPKVEAFEQEVARALKNGQGLVMGFNNISNEGVVLIDLVATAQQEDKLSGEEFKYLRHRIYKAMDSVVEVQSRFERDGREQAIRGYREAKARKYGKGDKNK